MNQYKFKSSHNSFANDLLHRSPNLSVIAEFLKEGYVGLEFDIQKDSDGIYVNHFRRDRDSPRLTIGDFLELVINHSKKIEGHDPFFLSFDLKSKRDRSVAPMLVEEILQIFKSFFPDQKLDDIFILPKDEELGSLEKRSGKYIWPSIDDCKGKFLLSIHKRHHVRINDQNAKKYFFVDNRGCMANYNVLTLNRSIWGWFQKRKLRKKLSENAIIRIYPSPMNQVLESNYFNNSAKLNAQLIAVDFGKRRQAEFQFGLESKIIEYNV